MRKLVFSTINKQNLPFCTLPKYAYVIYEWFFRNLQHYNSRSNWEPTTKLCWRLFRLSNKLCDIKQHLILNSNIKYVTWKYIGNSTQYDHWLSLWYKNKIGSIEKKIVASWFCSKRTQQKEFLMEPNLFLYYEESLVSSNLNLKLLRFHSVRPNDHT